MKIDLTIKNIDEVIEKLQEFIKNQVYDKFRRTGVAIGISGGIDSAIVSVLCARALGPEKVLGLIMPEKESDPKSSQLAELLCKRFDIQTKKIDLTPILESYNIYKIRDEIVEKNFPALDEKSKYRVVVPDINKFSGVNMPYLQILDSKNCVHNIKLRLDDYLHLTAATSIKHRTRMVTLYYHAEKNHYVVAGTTNKTEWLQGYFVKYGDGGTDIEPIANLYKTQIYQLGKYLDIPEDIIKRNASPDTWSFDVSDQEFFFGLPYETIDLLLYAKENNVPIENVIKQLGISNEQIEKIITNQNRKQLASKHMREIPPHWDGKIIYN